VMLGGGCIPPRSRCERVRTPCRYIHQAGRDHHGTSRSKQTNTALAHIISSFIIIFFFAFFFFFFFS
jgi:hypothetical protein